MPSLADLYSMIGSAKRRAADTIANPGLSLAQMVGNANDRARVLNEQTAAAAQEGIDYGPASRQLAQHMAESYNPIGMTVWHGSPFSFDKFQAARIGSGEGNAAFGHGLYMAENPETAQFYKEKLTREGSKYQEANDARVRLQLKKAERLAETNPEEAKRLRDLASAYTPEGVLYKVDLPDTHVRRMLDWDEPIKNQPKQVRTLAKSLGIDMNDLGGDLLAKVGKGEEGRQILQNAGIRGIKYLDEGSRSGKNGTRNFVVFDPNHLTILERNNQPIK